MDVQVGERGSAAGALAGGGLFLPPPLVVGGGVGAEEAGPWERDALEEQRRRQRRGNFAVSPCDLQSARGKADFHSLDPILPHKH